MAFQVFGAVSLSVSIGLDLAKNGRSVLLRLGEMGIDVVDVDQHAVDDVGDGGPFLGRLAALSVRSRSGSRSSRDR